MKWCSGICTGLAMLAWLIPVPAQPRLILPTATSLRPGASIPEAAYVFDAHLQKSALRDLVADGMEVVVLVLFGGGAAAIPQEKFRGPLWCQDSFDDLAVQRAAINEFANRPVQFIGIAVPPVFARDDRYGFSPGAFLDFPSFSPEFQEAAAGFVEATEALRASSLLPFASVFYDPKLLTLGKERAKGDPADEALGWRGAFKAADDPRSYGAPTIWIFDETGVVMTEAFWGNDYGSTPPTVNYGFRELKVAIESALAASGAK